MVGVTGSFGSGKSTVSRVFARLGARIIDADKIARACLRPGQAAYPRLKGLFGPAVIRRGGGVNRRALADIVFASPQKLAALNALVHPCVLRRIRQLIQTSAARAVVVDAPLLIEAGLCAEMDALVVVSVSERVRLARMKRTGVDAERVHARLRNQVSQKQKEALADYIVRNDGTLASTKQQVVKIWHALKQKQRLKETKQK